MEDQKSNTFAQKAKEEGETTKQVPESQKQPVRGETEIDVSDLSSTAVGDQAKYKRPDLHNTEDVVEKFQVFLPDATSEPEVSQNGTTKYWKVTAKIWYESKNEDGLQNREYISGARSFQQQNGQPSDISFWYPGAETQMAQLWELVSKAKGIEPDRLSPREFVAFLNSKPKVIIESKAYKNFGGGAGDAKTINKNMPAKFEKA